jgi:predicted NBD/HSP70 family sugar kinase
MDKKPTKSVSPKAREIYRWIRRHSVASKHDLLKQTELPVSTLSRILDEMVENGLLEEAGLGESSGGRRPQLYQTNPKYAYVFGLDISRAQSRLILADLHLQTLEEVVWNMTDKLTPDSLIGQVIQAGRQMLERTGIRTEQLLGIGVGAVGPVDRMEGMILDPQYFAAPGWRDVPIRERLEAAFQVPVYVDNGANTAIRAEYWADSPLEIQNVLYVRAGVGLRSSMIVGGQVVYGAFDMEGAVGQMVIQTDGVPHRERADRYGCLESYVSIHAIEQVLRSRMKQGRDTRLREMVARAEEADIHHMLQALAERDPLTVEVFTQAATYFGIGLGNLLNTLHPQSVILGGPLIVSNELFFDVATRTAVRCCAYYPQYKVRFQKERLGSTAVAVGAVIQVIDETFA